MARRCSAQAERDSLIKKNQITEEEIMSGMRVIPLAPARIFIKTPMLLLNI
jgi:hypothetical protein